MGKVHSESFKSSTPANEGDKETNANKDKKHKIDPLHNDWRRFECNTWHLEPTVRLISTFGSQIEPYGVDLILSKLGFSHARTTIPKWLQRGCMDPMDKIMSIIVLKAIQSVKEDAKQSKQNTEQSLVNDGNSASASISKYNSPNINSTVSPYSSTPTTTSKVKSNNKHKPKAFR